MPLGGNTFAPRVERPGAVGFGVFIPAPGSAMTRGTDGACAGGKQQGRTDGPAPEWSRWLARLLPVFWLLWVAAPSVSWGGPADPARRVYQEMDFRRHPGLAAEPEDLVLLRLERAFSEHPLRNNHARYRLKAGTYRLCLEAGQHILRLVVRTRSGHTLVKLRRPPLRKAENGVYVPARACKPLRVENSGLHALIATHDGHAVGRKPRIAFIQPDPAVWPSLVDANGVPAGGYWALRPDAALDPSGRRGRIAFATATWNLTESLKASRNMGTLTLLASGKVLAAGSLLNVPKPSAEVYDPTTNAWTPTGEMRGIVGQGTATLLDSGKVLVAGGWPPEPIPPTISSQLFDPETGTWSVTSPLVHERVNHSAARLPSGKVLIAGAFGPSFDSAEVYDPVTGTWSLTGPLHIGRFNHTLVSLPSGQVLVAGGTTSDPSTHRAQSTADAELYDEASGAWTVTGSLATARGAPAVALLPSGRVLAASGYGPDANADLVASAEVYDPASGTWSPTGPMNVVRAGPAVATLPWGGVLVAGGGLNCTPCALASSELWDPASGEWALVDSLNYARDYPNGVLLPNGRMLVIGGTGAAVGELSNDVEKLAADFTTPAVRAPALFDFSDPKRPRSLFTGGPLDLQKPAGGTYWDLIWRQDPGAASEFFGNKAPLAITDLGQYRIRLGVRRADGGQADLFPTGTAAAGPMPLALNYDGPQPDPTLAAALSVLYRFYPDGTGIGDLQEGEVAVYQECNYRGRAAVFALDAADLGEISGFATTIAGTAASIRLGNNTGVTLYTATNFAGTSQVVETDTPCLDSTGIGRGTAFSLQIRPLAPTLAVSTGRCRDCRIQNVDLSGTDLSGVDLTGALLNGSNFAKAVLKKTIFNQASLQCSGSGSQARCVDLSNTQLQGARLNNANLTGASLYNAFLSNNLDGSITEAASLQHAHLKNVNLAYAKLSGVNFAFSNLYGDTAANSPPGCTTTGGNLSGFTKGCSTANSAVLTATDFSDAYLFGTDLGGTTMRGVKFGQAVLVGANFASANIGPDPNSGSATSFDRAFLQGTNLDRATTLEADLTEAFVDFSDRGNLIYINLNGVNHNAFACPSLSPACDPPSGQDVCVWVPYGQPTTVPADTPGITCPNGAILAAGCGSPTQGNSNWQSDLAIDNPPPGMPPAWYTQNASFTPAAPDSAICNGKGSQARVILW